MSGSYPESLRQRAIKFVMEEGGSRNEACRVLGIHFKTLQNWLNLYRKTGSISPASRKNYRKRKVDIMQLKQLLDKNQDATLAELAQHFGVYPSTIDYHLRKMDITRKKNHALSGTKRRKTGGISGGN